MEKRILYFNVMLLLLSSCFTNRSSNNNPLNDYNKFIQEQKAYNKVNDSVPSAFTKLTFTSQNQSFCKKEFLVKFPKLESVRLLYYKKDSTEITKCLCELSEVKTLKVLIIGSEIEAIPKEIKKLTSLESFVSKAKYLPNELKFLKSLKKIGFINGSKININQCTEILLKCHSLKEINMNMCHLQKFPLRLVKEHPTVKTIELLENEFKIIPCELLPVKSVEVIKVNHLLDNVTIPQCLKEANVKIL